MENLIGRKFVNFVIEFTIIGIKAFIKEAIEFVYSLRWKISKSHEVLKVRYCYL